VGDAAHDETRDAGEITIRQAGVDDAERLASLAACLFRQTYEDDIPPEEMERFLEASFNAEAQQAEIADPDTVTLLAEHGGEMVGYAQLRHRPPPSETDGAAADIELARIYLDRAWQGQGAGRRLLDELHRIACGLHASGMWLGVWERNARAIAFYANHGFTPVGVQQFAVGAELHRDLVMVEDLSCV
jgi:diamine N-acetyltransferase